MTQVDQSSGAVIRQRISILIGLVFLTGCVESRAVPQRDSGAPEVDAARVEPDGAVLADGGGQDGSTLFDGGALLTEDAGPAEDAGIAIDATPFDGGMFDGSDSGPDPMDASPMDAGSTDPIDAGPSGSSDAGSTGSIDAGSTGPMDAGVDAGPPATPDAGPLPPSAPTGLWPVDGHYTGTTRPVSPPIERNPLRPEVGWRASEGAESYRVQFVQGCDESDRSSCDFSAAISIPTFQTSVRPEGDLPNPSLATPTGSRHFWRVQACSASGCSAWSQVQYLNVGRLWADYDGSGYEDFAVSSSGDVPGFVEGPPTRGEAYLYLGGPTFGADGPPNPFHTLSAPPLDDLVVVGPVRFVGDLNADGFADLSVSILAYGRDGEPLVDDGAVHIYLGDNSSQVPSPIVIDGHFERFGEGVTGLGDIDGDGYDDMAVAGSGAVLATVYYGGPEPLTRAIEIPEPPSATTHSSYLETTVGPAGPSDLDGDGYPDIMIGRPDSGQVYLFRGREPATLWQQIDAPEPTTFGRFIDAQDLDPDGVPELAISSQSSTYYDTVILYRRQAGQFEPVADAQPNAMPRETEVFLGGGFRFRDLDGDGVPALMVGAPSGRGAPAGPDDPSSVYVYDFSRPDLRDRSESILELPISENRLAFGFALASGDFRGEGSSMLIVAGYDSGNTSQLYVFERSLTGLNPVATTIIAAPTGDAPNFGWHMAP